MPVKILPYRNFLADGNNRFSPQIQDLAPPPVLEVLDPTLPVPVRKRLRRRVHPGQLYFMFGDRVFRPVAQFLSDKKRHCPVADLSGARGMPPWGSKFFQFHAVFGKIWHNRMLAPPPRVGAPSSGKSWIRHCNASNLAPLLSKSRN